MSEKESKPSGEARGDDREPGFEASLAELESLVEALESGELSLADSLERFKRGVELSRHCHRMLDQARQSVEVLTNADDESSAREFGGSGG